MDLIRTVLELIQQKLNESLKAADPNPEDWVILSNIVAQDGRPYDGAKNKIVMVLANIQHETVISTNNPVLKTTAVPPPLYIDLYILFYANFYDENYRQGLAMISRTIGFFQQNAWFTHANMPALPPAVDKLTLELTNLDLAEVNDLMSMLGAKYQPSVFYKLRMLPFMAVIGDHTKEVSARSALVAEK